jgi:hypothetical protein
MFHTVSVRQRLFSGPFPGGYSFYPANKELTRFGPVGRFRARPEFQILACLRRPRMKKLSGKAQSARVSESILKIADDESLTRQPGTAHRRVPLWKPPRRDFSNCRQQNFFEATSSRIGDFIFRRSHSDVEAAIPTLCARSYADRTSRAPNSAMLSPSRDRQSIGRDRRRAAARSLRESRAP